MRPVHGLVFVFAGKAGPGVSEMVEEAYYFLMEQGCINFGIMHGINEPVTGTALAGSACCCLGYRHLRISCSEVIFAIGIGLPQDMVDSTQSLADKENA